MFSYCEHNNGHANGTHGGEQMSSDFNYVTVLPHHRSQSEEYIDSLKLMQMYRNREIIKQPSLSSSYYSSSSSSAFSSSPSPEYIMGNGSITSTAGIICTSSAQVSSKLNEDMAMNPYSSIQPSTPITTVNSYNQLDSFSQMIGQCNDAYRGASASSAGAPAFSFQLNNEDHPAGPSLVSHDQCPTAQYPCLTDHIVPYYSPINVSDSSTLLPSLTEPIAQHPQINYDQPYIDHSLFPESMVQSLECAYNASCNDQLDASYGMSGLQSYIAHETAGLGCCHDEEHIAAHHRSYTLINLPLLKCAETSQLSASQISNDQQPEWGNMYSNTDVYYGQQQLAGQATAHDVSGPAHVASTVFSTDLDAHILADQGFRAQDKLQHISVAQTESNASINKGLMGLISTDSEVYHETFSHNHILNHDQGVPITGLSTGLAAISCSNHIAAGTYGDYISADRDDDQRMQEESISRINEMINRGSSGISTQHTITRKSSGLQDQLQERNYVNYMNNVSSSVGTPQSNIEEARSLHVIAERKRRRKHGDCIDILRTLVPTTITKKKDMVTILKSTIEYIKKVQALACDCEKNKVVLGNKSNKDSQDEVEISCKSEHANIVIKSDQNMSSQTNATCKYIDSSSGQETLEPHFELCLATCVKNGNANVPIIEIIRALQKQNLHCIEFKSKFAEGTRIFDVNILATYKDGENCNPNMDEIQHIKQWWTHFNID